MADGVYKIDINVTGAPSGSERIGAITRGDRITEQAQEIANERPSGILSVDRIKEIATSGAATGIVVGKAALKVYQQNNTFKGDSNRNLKINSTMKWAGNATSVGGAAIAGGIVGGPVGAVVGGGLAIANLAFNLALENRELINERENDTYQSNYYQQRLVYDVSNRSR